MDFDISKVYTVCSLEEVDVGDYGYFSNDEKTLEHFVYHDFPTSKLSKITEDLTKPFFDEKQNNYLFFYLVKKSKKDKKNANEIVSNSTFTTLLSYGHEVFPDKILKRWSKKQLVKAIRTLEFNWCATIKSYKASIEYTKALEETLTKEN